MKNSHSFSIIGSGFGLYGYLVAISHLGETGKIFILKEYLPLILNLKIDQKIRKNIVPCKSLDELIANGDVIVIARRPVDQLEIIQNNIQLLKTKILLLEKPIAPSPRQASKLLSLLEKNQINFSVGFLFRYLHWSELICNRAYQDKEIKITWSLTDKGKLGWKKDKFGGGAVDLLGIHILAMMALHHFSLVDSQIFLNKKELEYRWAASFGKKNFIVNVELNSASDKNFFKIEMGDEIIYEDQTPYGKEFSPGALDTRLEPLKHHIHNAITSQNFRKELELNREIVCLWEQVRSPSS